MLLYSPRLVHTHWPTAAYTVISDSAVIIIIIMIIIVIRIEMLIVIAHWGV